MKICIATYGSRGDVQPIIALAILLQKAGHRVRLAAPPENGNWVRSFGVSFAAVGDSFMDFAAEHPDVHSPTTAPPFVRFLRSQAQSQFRQFPPVIAGADLALGCSLVFGLPSAAEAMGVPYRYIVFCPQVFRSATHPSLFARNHRLPASINRLTWGIDALADRLLFKPLLVRERKKLGLPPFSGTTIEHLLGVRPRLAAEPVLAPLPPDLKRSVVRIGYPSLGAAGRLGASLEAFLAEGPAPVYFGFGSMPYADRGKILATVLAAARRNKKRLVFSGGRDKRLGKDCHMVGPVDHGRMFRQVAMVIHHGGAGTTTTAARAGVPQIIVPHVLDQFYWARRVQDMGLGPAPLDRRRLRTGQIADRIRTVAEDPGFLRRAGQTARGLARAPELRSSVAERAVAR